VHETGARKIGADQRAPLVRLFKPGDAALCRNTSLAALMSDATGEEATTRPPLTRPLRSRSSIVARFSRTTARRRTKRIASVDYVLLPYPSERFLRENVCVA